MPEPEPAEQPGMPRTGREEAALLHDLTRWREQLARSIARNNLGMRSDAIATAVNRILLALIFLRIAEDRGLVGAGTLHDLAGSFSNRETLPALFRYTIPLYREDSGSAGEVTEDFTGIVLDEGVLPSVISGIASPQRRYDLAVMALENLAGILQQYLARTVRRSAAHQAVIADTRDTTQSGVTGIPPVAATGYLVRSTAIAARAARSRRELLPLRVLDPACGAGSILLAVYRDLLENYRGGAPGPEECREILAGSVHGIDISRHAVAVTRMLLFFRLAETMGQKTMPGGFFSFAEEVFRDLSHTILCGNALVGPEIARDESWMFCPPRDRQSIRPFSWQAGFPEIFAAGGFDAVISNPPEGPPEDREWIQQYFQRQYSVYHPRIDRSAFFLEKSLSLVRPGGSVSFLMSSGWLRGAAGSRTREVLRSWQIEEIVDLTGLPGALPGRAFCMIRVRASHSSRPFPVTIAGPSFYEDPDAFVSAHRFPVDPRQLDEGGWIFGDTRAEDIVRRIGQKSVRLEDFVMGQVFSGISVPENDPHITGEDPAGEWLRGDSRCKSLVRKLVRGKGIGRYCGGLTGEYVILVPRGWTARYIKGTKQPWQWFKRRYPRIARYLMPSRVLLETRAGPDELWWETDCDEFWQEKRKKILFPARFEKPVFLFDPGRAIGDETVAAVPSAGLYLPGVLNSRLLAFVFDHAVRRQSPRRQVFSWDDIRALPIYTPDFDRPEDHARHDRMEKLVQRRIHLELSCRAARNDAERENLHKKIRAADRQIDTLVYALYGLTEDEVAVIEESVGGQDLPAC